MNQSIPSLEEVRKRFAADRYATVSTGIEIIEVADRYAKCRLQLNDSHKNANGHVMGGVFFTLADFTFAVASNLGELFTVTSTAQISFMAVPQGEFLFAESILLKDGRTQCFFEIRITDETGKLIANASMNGTHVPKSVIEPHK